MRKRKEQEVVVKLNLRKSLRKNMTMYLFLLLPIIYFIVFKYAPMVGNVIAFRKYSPGKSIFGVKWVGFHYFNQFLFDENFWHIFLNTIILSSITLLVTFPLPIIFALLVNEVVNKKFKKIVQSITIIPKFFSTVVVIAMLNTLLSPSVGVINALIEKLGGTALYFMNDPNWFRPIYVTSEIWQFMGWSSITYLAVLSSADMEQYEAAMVDGATRMKQVIHITIPMMLPTIAINLIISIGNVLNVGFEKIILMYTPTIQSTADVLQTYIYRVGLKGGNFSYGTAIGLFQGFIGLVLLYIGNKITNKYWECGLW